MVFPSALSSACQHLQHLLPMVMVMVMIVVIPIRVMAEVEVKIKLFLILPIQYLFTLSLKVAVHPLPVTTIWSVLVRQIVTPLPLNLRFLLSQTLKIPLPPLRNISPILGMMTPSFHIYFPIKHPLPISLLIHLSSLQMTSMIFIPVTLRHSPLPHSPPNLTSSSHLLHIKSLILGHHHPMVWLHI